MRRYEVSVSHVLQSEGSLSYATLIDGLGTFTERSTCLFLIEREGEILRENATEEEVGVGYCEFLSTARIAYGTRRTINRG